MWRNTGINTAHIYGGIPVFGTGIGNPSRLKQLMSADNSGTNYLALCQLVYNLFECVAVLAAHSARWSAVWGNCWWREWYSAGCSTGNTQPPAVNTFLILWTNMDLPIYSRHATEHVSYILKKSARISHIFPQFLGFRKSHIFSACVEICQISHFSAYVSHASTYVTTYTYVFAAYMHNLLKYALKYEAYASIMQYMWYF